MMLEIACEYDFFFFLNGAGEMAQQVKALAAKADDTNSIPGTYLVEGEFHKLSSDCHTYP